jgi:hypothetical protein
MDVRVSWLAFDTNATPCDVRVSWVELDTAATQDSADAGGPKKRYIKRGRRYLIFASTQDAADYLAAEEAADKAIADAQRTSRRARKRLKGRITRSAPVPQSVEADQLALLVDRYALPFDLPNLFAQDDIDSVLMAYAAAMLAQDEDDIALLLMA